MNNGWSFNQQLIELVAQKECRQVFILGNSDSGKTTFLATLVNLLKEKEGVALVDLDAGQSRIGPPTTVAWGFLPATNFSWEKVKVEDMYFIGSTTAYGSLLPAVTGTVLICQAALKKAKKLFIDSCGLVSFSAGTALKTAQIQLVAPDLVLALAHGQELDLILEPFQAHPKIKTLKIKVPPEVGVKTVAQRTAYRERQFQLYFAKAQKLEVFWPQTTLNSIYLSVNVQQKLKQEEKGFFQNRLVSLRHANGFDLALAVILEVNFTAQSFTLLTPLAATEKEKVAVVIFSKLVLNPETGGHYKAATEV